MTVNAIKRVELIHLNYLDNFKSSWSIFHFFNSDKGKKINTKTFEYSAKIII